MLLEAFPGDDCWINTVPTRDFPKRCRQGAERRRFKTEIRKVAFNYLDSVDRQQLFNDPRNRPAVGRSDSATTDTDSDGEINTVTSQASA